MRRLAVLLIACAGVLVACGGNGKSDESSSAPPPKPKEKVAAYARRLEAAITAVGKGDCGPIEKLNASAGFAFPCTPAARKALRGFKVTGSQALGTAGVVEATDAEVRTAPQPPGVKSSPDDAREAVVVAIGADGRYTATGPIAPVLPATSIGTKPAAGGDQDARANAFLDSIRTRDCAKFFKYAVTPDVKNAKEACTNILDKAYSQLAAQLKAHKDAKPVREGGNGWFTVYGLRTGKQYRTLVVVKGLPHDPEPYLVMGTFKGPAG